MLADLERASRHVVFIQDNPRPPFYVPDCVAQHMKDLRRCAFAKQPATSNSTQVRETVAAADPGVTTIDATPEYCPRSLCPAVIGDALVYRNSGHVTDTYTTTMVPWIVKHLPSLSARRR
jgi:hypothetical protein